MSLNTLKYSSIGSFPQTRMRRNRKAEWNRRLIRENTLTTDDLILPVFIREARGQREIPAMPGVFRHTIEEAIDLIGRVHESRIPAIALFPCFEREHRSDNVLDMLTPDNMFCEAIRRIRKSYPDIGIITDAALDCYATHGQDGVVRNGEIVNDETNEVLSNYAVIMAEAGADVIAPSDMMDGRVGAIRQKLDIAGYQDTSIMAYAAKYISSFYGPFRDAVGSKKCLAEADKKTYQLDFHNSREAMREIALDIQEGADMIIIKPGLPYLDIVRMARDTFGVPTYSYHITGEYAMLKAASMNGWINYEDCLYESLIAFKRAGADGILTYAALDAADIIKKGY